MDYHHSQPQQIRLSVNQPEDATDPSARVYSPDSSQKQPRMIGILFAFIAVTILLIGIIGYLIGKSVKQMPSTTVVQPIHPTNTIQQPTISVLTPTTSITPPSPTSLVTGINTTTCCGCPKQVDQKQIGKDGWRAYEKGINYAPLLPEECKRVDCKPCQGPPYPLFISPTPSPIRVPLSDTTYWNEFSCGDILYKIPPTYAEKCTQDSVKSTSYSVLLTIPGQYGVAGNIMISQYDGGSRRQQWITGMNVTNEELSKYVRFQETQFGTISGLDVFASGGWWQGGMVSPILIANGKTLVSIYGGGRNFDDQTGKITRSELVDTIASTIRFGGVLQPTRSVGLIIGIHTSSCCSCPTKIQPALIGVDGWHIYESGKDYSSLRPSSCIHMQCSPCEVIP
jgi:hypothetical protein